MKIKINVILLILLFFFSCKSKKLNYIEYYHEVYGQYGFEGELMEISASHDGLPDADFIQRVSDLLRDDARRDAIATRNYQKGKSLLSDHIFRQIFNV